MGIVSFGSGMLSGIDGWLAQFAPAVLRLMFWAAVGALVSMELYRLASPQARIVSVKAEFERMQAMVSEFDGEFAEAWPYLRRMLALAFRRIGLVLPATLLASLPLIGLIVWVDQRYGPLEQVLSVGPSWIRGWHGVFFAAMIAFAFAFKTVRRIA